MKYSNEQQNGNENGVNKDRLGGFWQVSPLNREDKIDILIPEVHQAGEVFALWQEDSFYRQLVEKMNEGALILASDGSIIYCNHSFSAMIKISRDQLIQRTFWEIVYPEDRPILLADLHAKNFKNRYQINLLCRDGTILPVLFSISPVYIKGVENLAVIITDISKSREHDMLLRLTKRQLFREINGRKQLKAELQKSEDQKAEVLENMSEGFGILDSQLCFTYINRNCERIINRSCQEVIGLKIGDIFPSIGPEHIKLLENVHEKKIPAYMQMTTLLPVNRWLAISAHPGKNGTLVFLRDITRQKKIETDLRQSERKFSQVFHGTPIMMSILAFEDDIFLDVNDALCFGTGYTCEEFIGHTEKELNLLPDQDLAALRTQLVKSKGVNEYELTLRTKSGKMLDCLYWGRLLYLDGQLCHIAGLVDITEKRFLEKEMARLDRLNLVGEMAATIGHEIRNPMTSIRGFIQLLGEKECYKPDRLYFDLMIEELDRANAIISEYLGLARNRAVSLEPRQLDEMIRSIFPILVADANYQEKTIQLELKNPPLVLADEKAIRQLVCNIARNGLEAMDKGGVLKIGTTVEDDYTVLYIKDEGGGLESHILDKLGTPFTTTKENGTGLGLTVCYSIAAQHNAKLDYETGKNGTTFKVIFPATKQASLF